MTLTVKHIFIHPVKSMAGQAVDEASVTLDGLVDDRQYTVVNNKGTCLTARQYPKMLLIKVLLTEDSLTLISAGCGRVTIPRHPKSAVLRMTKVWGEPVSGLDMGDAVAGWLSEYIGKKCRLLAIASDSKRDGKYIVSPKSFADAAPVLLTSDASLNELNGRLEKPVSHRHFRANIVIEGDIPAFTEDYWAEVKIGDIKMEIAWGCSRCIMTSVDPLTGEKSSDMEPIKTLKSFRKFDDNRFYFGQNANPQYSGVIRVGDPVEIISTRDRLLFCEDAFRTP